MLSLVPEQIENYVLKHTSDVPDILKQLEDETYENVPMPQMLSGPVVGHFLASLIAMSHASRILEVGTFTGYATLMMANALTDEDGMVITIDRDESCTSIAQKYWSKSSVDKNISQLIGDADKILDEIDGGFDFIFIDADKENYPLYYEKCLDLLSPSGIIVLDNMLWSGTVADKSNNDLEVVTLRELADTINKDDRVLNVLLTVRDGLMVVRKKTK
ncbi:MAG: methyltransferase domain-containing protein [SAR202 cluster bacterium]|nr:methyltransferase domain-containing protein [SAR202 cluster bacterium]|tara:strand:+ start:276 stop:926 length:651 start_codon:yes stop_codon:yes gene_type:complete